MGENHFNKSVMLPKQMVYKENLGCLTHSWNVGKVRPLKKVQFCLRPRKAKILTTGIHLSISRIKI